MQNIQQALNNLPMFYCVEYFSNIQCNTFLNTLLHNSLECTGFRNAILQIMLQNYSTERAAILDDSLL